MPSGKHAEIVALFEHRTTFGTIKGWRKGRRRAPQWAIDLCAKRAAQLIELTTRAQAAIGPGQSVGARNLAMWHARKKEEAGNKAGP